MPTAEPRKSSCATQALQTELERIRRLSIEDRIIKALTMDRLYAELKPTSIT